MEILMTEDFTKINPTDPLILIKKRKKSMGPNYRTVMGTIGTGADR